MNSLKQGALTQAKAALKWKLWPCILGLIYYQQEENLVPAQQISAQNTDCLLHQGLCQVSVLQNTPASLQPGLNLHEPSAIPFSLLEGGEHCTGG